MDKSLTLTEKDIQQAIQELDQYKVYEIKSKEDLEFASTVVARARKIIRVITNELFKEQIDSAKNTLNKIKEAQNKLLNVPKQIEQIMLEKIKDYNEAIRRQEEAKRLAEMQRKIEEEKAIEEFFIKDEPEAETITKQVEKQVEEDIKKEIEIEVKEQTRVNGIIKAKKWKAKLVSLEDLVKAIANGEADINLISFNQSIADRIARETEGKITIKGIEFYQEEEIRIKNI